MSNYTLQVTWSGKDGLVDTDPLKVVSGADFNAEFTAIKTAINSKLDSSGGTDLAVADGGTGASTAANARTNLGVVNNATANEWTATQNFNATTLADVENIAWDASANQVTSVTITDNRTMSAPSSQVDGAFYSLAVIQDGTGSRTMTWNAVFKFPSATAPTLTTTASARDEFTFKSDGTNMYLVGQSLSVGTA